MLRSRSLNVALPAGRQRVGPWTRSPLPAGASTAAAVAPDRTGYLDTATALAQGATTSDFSDFRAIAASAADVFEVPAGSRAQVVISYGDQFANEDGTVLTYGYNNDFLAYFPLDGSDEALLFINHEYPAPFFQHGQTTAAAKTGAKSSSSSARSATRSSMSAAARTARGRSSPLRFTTAA
jgi:secreted PhoX family phosphatase